MPFLDVQLTSWSLDIDSPVRRHHPRPKSLRHADFEEKFDFLTVFYDCFWLDTGRRLALLGPPMLNLDADLELTFRSYPDGKKCNFERVPGFHVDSIYVDVPDGTNALHVCSRFVEAYLVPQPNFHDLFRNRRVITTLSKDNELLWIKDWATYYNRAHGCDGVLIYDNDSAKYSVQDVYKALSSLNDLQVVVLKWPFRYGLFDGRVPVSYDIWDWHPCQNGMLEHSRRRFLSAARSVLNVDVDELVVTADGESVFTMVEKSDTGHIRLDGLWVENHPAHVSSAKVAPPRHSDFYHVRAGRRHGCEEKWAVVPGRTPDTAQWAVHDIFGMPPSEHYRRAQLRHFKALNTDWAAVSRAGDSTRRTASSPVDPKALELDCWLRDQLLQTFSEEPDSDQALPAPHRDRSATSWRLHAGKLWSCGQVVEAIEAARKAIDLDGDYPAFRIFLGQMLDATGQPEEAVHQRAWAQELRESDGAYHCQLARLHLEERNFAHAEEEFLNSIAIAPGLPAAHLHLARLLDRSGKRAKSLQILELCIQRAPNHAMSRATLASRFIEDGRYPEAWKHASKAVELDPSNPHYCAVKGEALRLMGQLDEAEQVLRSGIALDQWSERRHHYGRETINRGPEPFDRWTRPSAPNLWHQLAYVFMKKGQLELAEEAALEAIALGSPSVNDHILLARIRLLQGAATGNEDMELAIRLARQEFDRPSHNENTRLFIREREEYSALVLADLLLENGLFADAEVVLKEARSRLTDCASLEVRHALLSNQMGDLSSATAILEEAICRESGNADLHFALSNILKNTNTARAIENAGLACDLDPTRGDHHIRLADLYIRSGRLNEAESVLMRAIAAMPEHPELRISLARVLEQRGDISGAISAIREVLALGLGDAWLWSHLGGLLLEVGAMEEALEALVHSDSLEANNAFTQYRLGRLHETRRDLTAAVPFFRRAAELAGRQGWIWSHLGSILLETGDLDSAKVALDRALESDPHGWLNLYRVGRLLELQGDIEASIRTVRTAIELKPDQAWMWSHLGHLLMQLQLWAEAESALRRALLTDPTDATTKERLVRLQEVRP